MIPLLAGLVLLTFPYIALAVNLSFGALHLDTPVADLAGAALLPLVALGFARRPTRLPGAVGFAAFVLLALVALPGVPDRCASAWFLLRKPLFFYVAYGGALAWVVARVLPPNALRVLLLTSVAIASAISLATSALRISVGDTLWFTAIEGLTNNHKTLAVALAPLIPLTLSLRRSRVDLVVTGIALAAIALSLSRTAWISAAVGLAYFTAWQGRLWASRRAVVLGVVVIGFVVALYGPLLARSAAQLDAARSRHSLDKRALEMVSAYPALGMGGGANVRFEQQTFPDYRVNGVDAHGAIQKVASEFGGYGLAAWLTFAVATALPLRRRAPIHRAVSGPLAPPDANLGAWATFVALHVNLLLSTETFSQTHWVPLAVVWGLSQRRTPRAGP